MDCLQIAEHFPTIDEIAAGRKKCSYWLYDKDRHCRKPARPDRSGIKRQGELVIARGAESPSTTDLRSCLIEELLERSCCKLHWTKLHADTDQVGEIRRQWRSQLKNAAPEHSDIKTEVDSPSTGAGERLNPSPVESSTGPRAAPRYNTRSTGKIDPSQVGRADGVVDEFLPMKKPRQTVGQKLLKGPTSDEARAYKDLYAYGRPSSPGILKIGYSKDVADRLNKWSKRCRYEPILKHHLRNVPCARFAEGLIHYELLSYWLRETQCKHNPDCTVQHQEWFRVDDETAFGVMDRWHRWMTTANPYDDRGHLRPNWRSIIENMERNGILVTSQRLLDAMADSRVDVAAPSANDAVAPPTENTTLRSSDDRVPKTPVNATTALPATRNIPTANPLSAIADMILSFTPEQKQQLQALLDRGTRNNTLMSLTPLTPLVAAA